MGALTLPSSGLVYVDSNSLIYSVEKHPLYGPLWQAAQAQAIEVVSSELALMETLVGPFKNQDSALVQSYEQALLGTDLRCTRPRHCSPAAHSLSPMTRAIAALQACP